jgi:RNA polymerase sigma-70 factor, ECF subfamily
MGAGGEERMTQTPVSLLERLRQPFDPEAWARFVALYTPLIFAWGRGVGLQESDAADLVQEVFVTLLQVLPTFSYDRRHSFRRWLRAVTLNKWRNARKLRDNQALQGQAAALDAIADDDALEARWEAEFQAYLVARALEIMRADFHHSSWQACWQVVVAGRPPAEVAAELGLTTGAVYAAKFRVLDRLRQELQGMLD